MMMAMLQAQDEMWAYLDKCEAIMEWSQTNPNFDTKFVEGVIMQIEEKQFITPKQETAIDNILYGCNIDY